MKRTMLTTASIFGAFLSLAIAARAANDANGPAAQQAKEILESTGFQGGLIVHIGCGGSSTSSEGPGQLTAALRIDDKHAVQGLDANAANVEKARSHVQSLGLYGAVSANLFDGKRLPYVDNLVNLVVAEDLGQVPMEEVMRVLAPLGAACVKQGDTWKALRKPWPKDIDEWQQHFHGADNNAVAHDNVVGPPRHYQWVSTPEWQRSHLGLPSMTSLVSSKGRLFDVEDQAPAEHPALPGKFTLVARDAFNGITLWQRRFPDWEPVTRTNKAMPVQIQRRVAAIGDVVYCTPGLSAPVTAFDAATGKVIKTYDGTEQTQEFVFDRGVLYLVIGDRMNAYSRGTDYRDFGGAGFGIAAYGSQALNLPNPKCSVVAIEAESGRKLWEKPDADTHGYQGGTLALRGEYAAYCTADGVVCLDRTTGRQIWRAETKVNMGGGPKTKGGVIMSGIAPTLVISDDAVYMADSNTLYAYSLKDGRVIWKGRDTLNHHKPADLFVVSGTVWSGTLEGLDAQTGKILKTLNQKMTGPMGHTRCYRDRITDRYYIDTATGGSDFLGLNSAGEFPNPWTRGTCGIGILPCNGLLYAGPPACSCCNWVMLNAFNALAPEPGLKSSAQPIEIETVARLEKGPAYGQISNPRSQVSDQNDWPTYRHDSQRSGVTKAKAPAELTPCWRAKVTTRPSAPVIAAGKVFVADVDAHAVCALDASDGRALWKYTAGARVDSPPTYYKGLLLFGSRDGWVYCLRASDGALAWRFKDLPERWICAYSQLESAWPVCGSVLVKDDIAYFAAGRNSFLDGGVFVYGLDPQTGRVVYRHNLYGPYGADGFPVIVSKTSGGSGINGCKADIFLTDGQFLYLRQQAFKADLTPLSPEQTTRAHLIPSAGFLETIPHHRTFWTIDTTIRYDIQVPKGTDPWGDILVMDGNEFYEVRGYAPGRTYNFDPRPNGYTLFAGTYAKPGAAPNRSGNAKLAESQAKGKKTGKPAEGQAVGKKKKTGAALKVVNASAQRWSTGIPLAGKAMSLADGRLFVAGTPVAFPADDLSKAYEGRMGGIVWMVSAQTGKKIAESRLDSPPAWDGMAVANGNLFVSLKDGQIVCMGGSQ